MCTITQKGKWRVTLVPSGLTGIETIGADQIDGTVLLAQSMDLQPAELAVAAPDAPGGDIEAAYQQMTLDQPRVFSIYGEEIDGPLAALKRFEDHWLRQDDPRSIPRRILSRIAISSVTGCWIPDYYMNYSGYAGATDRQLGMTPSGQSGLHRVTRARQELFEQKLPLLTPEHDVDHICRNTSCCNPGHLKRLSSKENNVRKDDAVPLEVALKSGQLAMIGANGHNYEPVAALLEGYKVVLSTRYGAMELQQLNKDTLIIVTAKCVIRERRRRLGKKPTKRYEKPNVNEHQFQLEEV